MKLIKTLYIERFGYRGLNNHLCKIRALHSARTDLTYTDSIRNRLLYIEGLCSIVLFRIR